MLFNGRLCDVVLELSAVARSFQSLSLDEEAKKHLSGACHQGLSVNTAKGLLENAPALNIVRDEIQNLNMHTQSSSPEGDSPSGSDSEA